MLIIARVPFSLLASGLCSLLILSVLISSCTTVTQTTRPPTEPAIADPNSARIDALLGWLDNAALQARSIHAEGDITVSTNESQQSGSFVVKSKRLAQLQSDPLVTDRIDSVSIQVYGPFGISVAKFLASPERYAMYSVLQGETMEGPTDARALEELTRLKGISLQAMNDVLFGLPPAAELIDPQDSILLFSRGATEHILLIYRFREGFSEAIAFNGVLRDDDQPILPEQLRITRYERWKKFIGSYDAATPKPDIKVLFSGHKTHNRVVLPNRIELTTGNNRLEIEYDEVAINPNVLTVYINVPR